MNKARARQQSPKLLVLAVQEKTTYMYPSIFSVTVKFPVNTWMLERIPLKISLLFKIGWQLFKVTTIDYLLWPMAHMFGW